MRSCGTCQLCCRLLPVRDKIAKPQNTRCKFQKHRVGCTVHGTMFQPDSCKVWRCWWLMHPDSPLPRPDHAGYVVDPTPDFVVLGDDAKTGERMMAVQVWQDPQKPTAHRDPALRKWLEAQSERRRFLVVVRTGVMSAITLVPPNMSETGSWIEIDSSQSRMMEAHTVGEIRRTMIEERLEALSDAKAQNDT